MLTVRLRSLRGLAPLAFAAVACAAVGCGSHAERSAGGMLVFEVAPASGAGSDAPVQRSGRMVVGERLEVRLGAYAGTGYLWTLAGPVPACFQMTTADPAGTVRPQGPADGRVGGGTMTTFGMTAIGQGEGTLRFVLARPWESGAQAAPARTVDVEVRVDPRPAR